MPGALATTVENEKDVAVFLKGCSLMQAQIAMWLIWKGNLDLATKVIEMPPPKFQPPDS